MPLSLGAGLIATLIGLVTFVLSWNFYEVWNGPIPGYQVLLFPGNMSLVLIWHPLFTEEIALYPKLALILLGQFVFVALFFAIMRQLLARVVKR